MTTSTERPIYRILSVAGFFGPDDHLHKEGSEIYFDGEPNEDMEPLNVAASQQMEKFFDKLEASARKIAAKAGIEYTGRPRSLEAAVELSTMAARRASTVQGDGGIPIMGGDKSRARETIGRVDEMPVAETSAKQPTRKPQGRGIISVSAPPVTPLSKVASTLA